MTELKAGQQVVVWMPGWPTIKLVTLSKIFGSNSWLVITDEKYSFGDRFFNHEMEPIETFTPNCSLAKRVQDYIDRRMTEAQSLQKSMTELNGVFIE